MLLAKRVSENRPPVKKTSTSSAVESFLTRSKISAALSCVSMMNKSQLFLNAEPTLILRNLEGAAPCPVPITCCGWPLPQFGVPQSVHSSREQMASIEFQNSVVMPEYDGFFNMRVFLPPLISQANSQPNWKL